MRKPSVVLGMINDLLILKTTHCLGEHYMSSKQSSIYFDG